MVCTAEPSGVRRPPWEVLPSRRPIVQRPRADCEDDPEPGTHTSRKKGLAQGAAIRRPHQVLLWPDLLPECFHVSALIDTLSQSLATLIPDSAEIKKWGKDYGLHPSGKMYSEWTRLIVYNLRE